MGAILDPVRVRLLLSAALLVSTLAPAQDNDVAPEPTALTYIAEGAGGALGMALGLGAGVGVTLLAYRHVSGEGQGSLLAGALVGLPAAAAGAAGGTCLAGAACRQRGRYLPTLGYSVATVAAGTALVALGVGLSYDGDPSAAGIAVACLGEVVLLATPIITTVGYNRSRQDDEYGMRLEPGNMACRFEHDRDGTRRTILDARLLNLRF